jgi:hypothetical protein
MAAILQEATPTLLRMLPRKIYRQFFGVSIAPSSEDKMTKSHEPPIPMSLKERWLEYLASTKLDLRGRLIEAVSDHEGWEESAIALVDEAILPVLGGESPAPDWDGMVEKLKKIERSPKTHKARRWVPLVDVMELIRQHEAELGAAPTPHVASKSLVERLRTVKGRGVTEHGQGLNDGIDAAIAMIRQHEAAAATLTLSRPLYPAVQRESSVMGEPERTSAEAIGAEGAPTPSPATLGDVLVRALDNAGKGCEIWDNDRADDLIEMLNIGANLSEKCSRQTHLGAGSCNACRFGELAKDVEQLRPYLRTREPVVDTIHHNPACYERHGCKCPRTYKRVPEPVTVKLDDCARACSDVMLFRYGEFSPHETKNGSMAIAKAILDAAGVKYVE